MDRLTNTDKWKDSWFLELEPGAKLLFVYLYENCDEAGFFKLDSAFMCKLIKSTPEEVVDNVLALGEKIIFNNDKKNPKIWMKNFLFHQKKLPLQLNNLEHKNIKLVLEKNIEDFNYHKEIQFILDKVETGKKKTSPRAVFKKPTLQEFKEYANEYTKNKGLILDAQWSENLYNHYVSNGWKIGGKTSMVDWKAAIRKNSANNKNSSGGGRLDKLTSANEGTTD